MSTLPAATAERIFREHQRFVWGLCYRLTGSAADADDLVQATFVRAMERPPARTDDPWRPWLVRVAMNLGRDLLRRRRRSPYQGPWLPSPIETTAEALPPSSAPAMDGEDSPEGRYERLESVSFAFLLALEVLTPQQRAVLLLRDVCGYSIHETATALGLSESNVKTSLYRARRAMQEYDHSRCLPTPIFQEKTRRALEQFMLGLAHQDTPAIEALLAEEVRTLNDGGGEFVAARVPIVGRDRVMRFYFNISKRRPPGMRVEIRLLNGLPAMVAESRHGRPGEAPRMVVRCDIDPDGRIKEIHAILATRKLTAVRF